MAELMQVAQDLRTGVELSDKRMEQYRKSRMEVIRKYSGMLYATGEDAERVGHQPMPLIAHMVTVILTTLMYQRNVRFLCRTENKMDEAQATARGKALSDLSKTIGLGNTLRQAILGALFGWGCTKVGVAPVDQSRQDLDGPYHDQGMPFCDNVSFDDIIIDPAAPSIERAKFIGNRYLLPAEYVRQCGLFKDAEVLIESSSQHRNKARADKLSTEQAITNQAMDLMPTIAFVDLWLPGDGVVLTMPCDGQATICREVQWSTAGCLETGPYDFLSFHDVPDNALPLPPTWLVNDLHDMANRMARKLVNQAERSKNVLLYDQTVAEEAQGIRDAADGGTLAVQNVDKHREVSLGKVNQDLYPAMNFVLQQFQRVSGNPDLLGGSNQTAGTATQDQLLFANASARIGDMKTRVREFASSAGNKIAALYFTDEGIRGKTVTVDFAGESLTIPLEALGDESRYDYGCDLYSQTPDDPSEQLRRLTQALSIVGPVAAAQGGTIDAMHLADKVGRLLDIPELSGMLQIGQQQAAPETMPDAMPQQAGPRMAIAPGSRPQPQREPMPQPEEAMA